MNLLMRRRMMLQQQSQSVDTSPRIAETGVNWNRTVGGKTANADWCITELYNFNPKYAGAITLTGYIGKDSTLITFQWFGHYTDNDNPYQDYYYFNAGDQEGTRRLANTQITRDTITFSIRRDKLDDCYMYVQETGQIIFAGRNSAYYGYTNISQIPT